MVQEWQKGFDKGDIMIKTLETKIPYTVSVHGLRGGLRSGPSTSIGLWMKGMSTTPMS